MTKRVGGKSLKDHKNTKLTMWVSISRCNGRYPANYCLLSWMVCILKLLVLHFCSDWFQEQKSKNYLFVVNLIKDPSDPALWLQRSDALGSLLGQQGRDRCSALLQGWQIGLLWIAALFRNQWETISGHCESKVTILQQRKSPVWNHRMRIYQEVWIIHPCFFH